MHVKALSMQGKQYTGTRTGSLGLQYALLRDESLEDQSDGTYRSLDDTG